ncbi:LysR family transcriptional regulator [Nocardia wallacei]|uniref:LysR family transcriptional regulator n=1 Tax=Nocardia wallacei TaxID=480035 RepID=UPI0024557C25|nr:LysR family transcriptional regulator [Nocardia wallacei]
MELRQLRYFVAVAERRHLTRAAEELGIRATSLSQQIIALEREFGTSLFDRTPSGMTPTAAAHALLPHARRALDAVRAGEQAVRASAGPTRPWRIGVTPGVRAGVVAALRNAAGDLDVRDLPVSEQLRRVPRGELDAALIVLPAETGGLRVHTVSDVPLGVLVSAAHPLAGAAVVGWNDLDGRDLLWFDRELAPGYHDAMLDTFRRAGWQPRRIRRGPPRRGPVLAELAVGDVVAVRPRWDATSGAVWRELAHAPRLRHALVWDPEHRDADRLSDLAVELAGEA